MSLINAIQQHEIRQTIKNVEELRDQVEQLTLTVSALSLLLEQKGGVSKQEMSEVIETLKNEPLKDVNEVAAKRGKLKCPGCRQIFTVKSKRDWDGERHIPCGTRIKLIA